MWKFLQGSGFSGHFDDRKCIEHKLWLETKITERDDGWTAFHTGRQCLRWTESFGAALVQKWIQGLHVAAEHSMAVPPVHREDVPRIWCKKTIKRLGFFNTISFFNHKQCKGILLFFFQAKENCRGLPRVGSSAMPVYRCLWNLGDELFHVLWILLGNGCHRFCCCLGRWVGEKSVHLSSFLQR